MGSTGCAQPHELPALDRLRICALRICVLMQMAHKMVLSHDSNASISQPHPVPLPGSLIAGTAVGYVRHADSRCTVALGDQTGPREYQRHEAAGAQLPQGRQGQICGAVQNFARTAVVRFARSRIRLWSKKFKKEPPKSALDILRDQLDYLPRIFTGGLDWVRYLLSIEEEIRM